MRSIAVENGLEATLFESITGSWILNLLNKIIAVAGIFKNCPAFDAAANDVMQGSGGVYPCFSRHAGKVTC